PLLSVNLFRYFQKCASFLFCEYTSATLREEINRPSPYASFGRERSLFDVLEPLRHIRQRWSCKDPLRNAVNFRFCKACNWAIEGWDRCIEYDPSNHILPHALHCNRCVIV